MLRNLLAVFRLLPLCLVCWFPPAAQALDQSGAQILILHSYSQEYPWTKYQHQGFIEHLFSQLPHPPSLSTEYLDTKRKHFDAEYIERYSAYLDYKYRDYHPELIYVTDDNALSFALAQFDRLFPGVPVIFSGVNDYSVEQKIDPARITGVFEKKDIATNIELLGQMNRHLTDILVVGDGSNTYHSIEKEIRQALQQHPKINATYLADSNIDQLVASLRQRDEKYLFLTTLGKMVNASGRTVDLRETIGRIAAAGEFVILSMEDAYLFDGVLGGFVTSGRQQGRNAASLALAYLSGAGISDLAAVTNSPNEYIFDQRELDKYGLKLPPHILDNATILNKPPSFYERNRTLILGLIMALVSLVFVLMTMLLVILSLKNRQIEAKSSEVGEQANALRRVRDSLTTAQRIAHLGSWERDLVTDRVSWSDEEFRLFGEIPQSFEPTHEIYLSYIAPEEHDKVKVAIATALEQRTSFEADLRIVLKDGTLRFIRELGYVTFDTNHKPVSMVGTTLDVTAIRQHELHEKERFERIERYQDALLEWSRVDYKNVDEAFARATEISAHTLNVQRVSIWLYSTDRSAIECQALYCRSSGLLDSKLVLHKKDFPAYFKALESGRALAISHAQSDEHTREFTEAYLKPLNIVSMLDAPIFHQGEVVGVVCHEQTGLPRDWSSHEQEFASAISKSVSLSLEMKKRKDIERQLEHQAYHDSLTNLPNRSLFMDRLEQSIRQSKRAGTPLAVLFLDLDNFKGINDSLGHATGDQVLIHIANKLSSTLREVDTVARLGGDEFTLIISSFEGAQKISDLAMKLVNSIQESMVVGSNELYITSSIGISIYPNDGDSAEALLRNADAAMYRAKDEGRNSFQFYTEDMTERAFERVLMETSLRRALENSEFTVYYQPQYDISSDQLTGMEALLRWQHPEMGLVPPAQFIPAAEETGLIVPIDQWVMRTALQQFAEWYRQGLNPGRLSLNLAVKQLYQDNLIELIEMILQDTGCKAEWLALEITESKIMTKPEQAAQVLQRISQLGIEIAMDDFGTGHSSLAYLKRLPVDTLKIDKSFVRDIPDDEDDAAIVRAVIALSRSMKLGVIAEGVETQQQKEFLLREGCTHIQGYLYGRPISASDMQALLVGDRPLARKIQ